MLLINTCLFKEQNTQFDGAEETQSSVQDYESVISPSTSTATSSTARTPTNRASKRGRKADNVLEIVAQKLQAPAEKPQDFDNFGKHVAEQMRKMPKEQAVYLSKIISDAIFEAQCGTLTRKSHIASPPDFPVTDHRYLPNQEYPRQSDIRGSNNFHYHPEGSDTLASYFSNTVP